MSRYINNATHIKIHVVLLTSMESDPSIICAAGILWSIQYKNKKCCQLCKAHQAPLWRKFKHYTELCNRCGIRMKSYKKI